MLVLVLRLTLQWSVDGDRNLLHWCWLQEGKCLSIPIKFHARLPVLLKGGAVPERAQAGSLAAEPEREEPVGGGGY